MAQNQTHFEIFGLEPGFEVDRKALAERYRELQREFHPDKYASKSDREQLLAMQYAAQINEAHGTLRDPVRRAGYLLKLAGVEVSPERTTSDAEFLMQQMMLRERLEEVRGEADPAAALDELSDEVHGLFASEQKHFAAVFADGDLDAGKDSLLKLQFLGKLQKQVEELEEDLLD
ncbi:Fe-S protein assembly co-chaperone HscB [Microbulbifer halophilus]|uniref:Co-chaperone protein HscB homolog n=1 Tax=Microbulbifer halophilus TaxID=453963 RepID=A0ABW5E938_9GAMM|nr:Fe-S protein assembly co-chaperone HscB [Microbulbifer halophilus]MCW8125340.1 Fe-S protein assembly co-chaperone HscB [Microbulbifer halophilus]